MAADTPTVGAATGINIVQGIGYLGYALGVFIIDKNTSGAMQDLLKAFVAFTGANIAGQVARDLQKLTGPPMGDEPKLAAGDAKKP